MRDLRSHLARAVVRAGVIWAGVSLGAVVVYVAPPYMRFYG